MRNYTRFYFFIIKEMWGKGLTIFVACTKILGSSNRLRLNSLSTQDYKYISQLQICTDFRVNGMTILRQSLTKMV